MAATLLDLHRWRDALFESRLSGIREVRDSNGETITYRSDAEMAAALAAADRAIADATKARPRTIHFSTTKGL